MKKIIVLFWIFIMINIFAENMYVNIKKYSEGVIAVKSSNGKYGYVDKTGKVVIPFKYDDAEEFHNGTAVVYIKDGYTLIDKSGKILLGKIYAGLMVSSSELIEIYDKETKKYGYINNRGEIVIPLIYDNATYFENGVAFVKINEKYRIIDTNGKSRYEKTYDYATAFIEGIALVINNDKYGFVDETGKEIITCIYDKAVDFYNGKTIVIQDNKEYIIDKSGNILSEIKTKYTIEEYNGKFILIRNKTGKLGLLDLENKIVSLPIYDSIGCFENNYAVVGNENDEYGLIDKTGKEIIPLKYLELINFGEDGFIYAEENEFGEKKYGFMDKKLKKITKAKYDYASGYNDGYAVIIDNLTNGKCGLIDKTGKEYYIGKVKDFVTEE